MTKQTLENEIIVRAEKKTVWRRVAYNWTLDGDGFTISFNEKPGSLVALFASDHGGAETAIVKDHRFYILNGDFRQEYAELVPKGFEACRAFYEANKARAGSSWSSDS